MMEVRCEDDIKLYIKTQSEHITGQIIALGVLKLWVLLPEFVTD